MNLVLFWQGILRYLLVSAMLYFSVDCGDRPENRGFLFIWVFIISLFSVGVPGPAALSARALDLAGALNLRCPSVNASLWLRRYQTELNLPEVCPWIRILFDHKLLLQRLAHLPLTIYFLLDFAGNCPSCFKHVWSLWFKFPGKSRATGR